jgi:N-acetylglutamate synthase-like GNAT family acetyltransferase
MDKGNDRVRAATTSDLEAVLKIAELTSSSTERESLLKLRVESGECLVSENQSRVVGFVTLARRSFFGRDFIELLAVDPDYRRKGVGGALLRGSVNEATTSAIFVSTNRSNHAMLNLLGKERWQFSGELEGLDEGDPELVFYRSTG